MRYLEDPSRAVTPVAGTLVRWLPLALVAGGVVLAVIVWQEFAAWPIYVAGGAHGAVTLGGALRSRSVAESSSLVRQSEAGWAALNGELARSRRHDRRFAIVAVPGDLWVAAGSDADHVVEAGLQAATAVQGLLRRPDVAWTDGSSLQVLLTDCDRQQADAFLERARASMPQLFADEKVRLAVFPDDGVTLGALLAAVGADGQALATQALAMQAPGL